MTDSGRQPCAGLARLGLCGQPLACELIYIAGKLSSHLRPPPRAINMAHVRARCKRSCQVVALYAEGVGDLVRRAYVPDEAPHLLPMELSIHGCTRRSPRMALRPPCLGHGGLLDSPRWRGHRGDRPARWRTRRERCMRSVPSDARDEQRALDAFHVD